MKISLIKFSYFTIFFLFLSTQTNKAFSAEISVGKNFSQNIQIFIDNDNNNKKENIFITPNMFYGYRTSDNIDSNLGFKIDTGYEINNGLLYGSFGYQKIFFDDKNKYKKNHGLLYGSGIGYRFAENNIVLKLGVVYSDLERGDGNGMSKIAVSSMGVGWLF